MCAFQLVKCDTSLLVVFTFIKSQNTALIFTFLVYDDHVLKMSNKQTGYCLPNIGKLR